MARVRRWRKGSDDRCALPQPCGWASLLSLWGGIESRDLPNWTLCVEALATAEPLWAPGTASWYHPFTFGYLNGEAIRRVTGTSAGDLFAERIARPLGVDFWIGGLPADRETDVTHRNRLNLLPPTGPAELWSQHGVDLSDPVVRELLEEVQSIPDMMEFLNTTEGHQMEFGGAGGIANARSVAKIYAATIGEIDSIRLLSPTTLDIVTQPRTSALGPVPQLATVPNQKFAEFGLGFWLGSQFESGRFASGGTFGQPGAGGNIGFAHPESNMAVAYTCTGMWSDSSRPDTRMGWAEPLADLAGA